MTMKKSTRNFTILLRLTQTPMQTLILNKRKASQLRKAMKVKIYGRMLILRVMRMKMRLLKRKRKKMLKKKSKKMILSR